MNLTGKTILISGAATGIGKALAQKLSKEKTKLVLLSRRMNLLEELAVEITNNGSTPLIFKCDVAKRDEVLSVFKEIGDKLESIDVAVLNSGISHRTSLETVESKIAQETFDVNVMGLVHCVEALTGDFFSQPPSIIAGVSSLADGRGFPKSGFYCASKAAATIYLESLRNELAFKGIKVITIKPGFVKTPMTDKNEFEMPFLMPVEKSAEIIFRGLMKEKTIIQFPLPTVMGTKLLKLLPNKIFDFFARNHLKKTLKK